MGFKEKTRTKKVHTIQFYPDVSRAGKDRAKSIGISFQQYLEDLILDDVKASKEV